MTYTIDDLVYSLLGMIPPNMGISGASEPDPELETLTNREYLQVLMDGSMCGDEFRWFYRRGIPLDLVDAEHQLELREQELSDLRDYCVRLRDFCKRNPNDIKAVASLRASVAYGIELRDELDVLKRELDLAFVEEDDDPGCPSLGLALYNYLEMYIDQMTLGQLAVAMDVIEELSPSPMKRKYKQPTISWYYYVQCGLAVSYRLAKATGLKAWCDILATLREHNEANHTKTISYEDRFSSDMSLDMEDAIDLMAEVRHLAALNHKDEWDMYVEVMTRREEACGILEGWAAPLPQAEVDALNSIFTKTE